MLDTWEDVKGVVHHQDLSCVPGIIWAELTSHFGIKKLNDSLPGKGTRPEVATSRYLPIRRAPVTILSWLTRIVHHKPVQITINAPGLAEVFTNL